MLRNPIESPVKINGTNIRMVGLHELYGAKLAALATRAKVRDLFDIYYLIKNIDKISVSEETLKNYFIFYWALQKVNDLSLQKAYDITYKEYFSDLKPCLFDNQIPTLPEMWDILKSKENSFVILSSEQQNFINGFRKGYNLSHLLFGVTIQHPALTGMKVESENDSRENDLL